MATGASIYREGESVQAVATLLELSEGAVKKRLSRARQAIRDDVLPQLEGALAGSAPGLAFTTMVMASADHRCGRAGIGRCADRSSGSPVHELGLPRGHGDRPVGLGVGLFFGIRSWLLGSGLL